MTNMKNKNKRKEQVKSKKHYTDFVKNIHVIAATKTTRIGLKTTIYDLQFGNQSLLTQHSGKQLDT